MLQQIQFKSIVCITILLLVLIGCGEKDSYSTDFDSLKDWGSGQNDTHHGRVEDGVYKYTAEPLSSVSWVLANESFENGEFSVDMRQTLGTSNYSGYGMIIRYDDSGAFYLFQISSDGQAYIGRCANNNCTGRDQTVLVEDWWFSTDEVEPGLNVWNNLKIRADHGNLQFLINDIVVGSVTDYMIISGDMGIFIENDSPAQMEVEFDNFTLTPLQK